MTYTPTESVRERAFEAWQNTSASLPLRERLDAVLVAVGPSIAAGALREAAEAIPGSNTERGIDPYDRAAEWLIDRADQIEQEARSLAAARAGETERAVCEWCPAPARGSAWHNDGQLHPSCGQVDHGWGWVPDDPAQRGQIEQEAR